LSLPADGRQCGRKPLSRAEDFRNQRGGYRMARSASVPAYPQHRQSAAGPSSYEAQGLRKDVIRRLLVTLECIPPHAIWVFTTTTDGEALFEDSDDGGPLASRCLPLRLARRDLPEAFATRPHRPLR
jgi:hypothetical protein